MSVVVFSRGFTVKAVEKFGHAPEYPVTNNWSFLVQQLHDFATQQAPAQGAHSTQPVTEVASTTMPKAMRYQANGVKLWVEM